MQAKMKMAPKAPVSEDKNVVTLAELCKELKCGDTYDARVKLRTAVQSKDYAALAASHKAKGSWQWEKGSAALKEARAVLTAK
jgi:hypothetical protein